MEIGDDEPGSQEFYPNKYFIKPVIKSNYQSVKFFIDGHLTSLTSISAHIGVSNGSPGDFSNQQKFDIRIISFNEGLATLHNSDVRIKIYGNQGTIKVSRIDFQSSESLESAEDIDLDQTIPMSLDNVVLTHESEKPFIQGSLSMDIIGRYYYTFYIVVEGQLDGNETY